MQHTPTAHPHTAHPHTAIVLLGHGSKDPSWQQPFDAMAERLRQLRPDCAVRCAYLGLCPPDLGSVCHALAEAGCQSIYIAPLFLGLGQHMRQDLPKLVHALQSDLPQMQFTLTSILGENAEIQDLLMQHLAATLAL